MSLKWGKEHEKEVKVLTRPPNPPDLNLIKHLWDVLDKHSNPWRADLTGFKGSSANILVPDIIAHCQTFCGVHALTYQTVLEAHWGPI